MWFIQACTYCLLAFVCCCNHKVHKKPSINSTISKTVSWDSPVHLLNSLLSDPDLDTENIDEAFRADLQFGDWKKDFPEQMMDCASNFSLDFGREVTADVFTHWVQKSYDNSVFYIENKMNESNLKDSAIIGMVNGLRVEQLSVAVSWAHEISDQSVRQQLLESLATQ